MTPEEIAEKYKDKDKYKNYNHEHAIAILIGLVSEINARNKILFKTLEENGINVEQMSDEKFTELRNDEMDKILSKIVNK